MDLIFSFEFDDSESEYFFALIHPFSYEELINFLDNITEKYTNDEEIYFHKEVIIKSEQGRPVHLLTISSHQGKLGESESLIDEKLFPCRNETPRAQR